MPAFVAPLVTGAPAAGLAMLLGAVGLYGVLSYVVAERTREIGVRMALGATAGAVRRLVVSQGARVVLIGVAVGAAAALASTRLLETLLCEVDAVDPAVFAAMAMMMVGIGMVASYVPARRASRVTRSSRCASTRGQILFFAGMSPFLDRPHQPPASSRVDIPAKNKI